MKPNNFPVRPSLDGSEEIYTQAGNVAQKFTLDAAKDFINQNISYKIEPSSVDLTKIPNNYIGWATYKDEKIYQSVEIQFVQKQTSITEMGGGVIYLAPLEKGEIRKFAIGDTVTISNSLNNNGEWKILQIADGALILDQTIEKYIKTEKNSPAILTWKERVLLELSWVHAQLEDGTLIWEAYSENQEGLTPAKFESNNNGYWVAMRPNSTSGEYEYVSHLKMTDNFWDYWYNYTVKVDGEPNSVILTTLSEGTGGSSNIGSYNFKLSLINDELVLVETIYDLEKTWNDLYFELTGNLANNPQFRQPWYNSDNDWYGMMKGEEMGWTWMWDYQYFVGYNMLNGQTQLIDISESLLNIKNIFYPIGKTENEILPNALKSIVDFNSHSKYGLLLLLDVNTVDAVNTFIGLWSPNFTNVEYVTILDFYDTRDSLAFSDKGLGGNSRWSINNDYFIAYESNSTNLGINFYRKELDSLNAKVESFTLPEFLNNTIDFDNYWERENSLIASFIFYDSVAQRYIYNNFFVWRNDMTSPKLIRTPNMYPNMIEDNKLTSWDSAWNYNNITTMTINFKNDVL
jgi:hypothetical protein